MACRFFNDEYAVFHGFFGGLRVRDLRDGRQIDPGYELKSKTLKTWAALPKLRFCDKRAQVLAERELFQDCGALALHIGDPLAIPLSYLSGAVLVEHYWRRGELLWLAEQ
jgi:hypothetical protein